MDGIRSILEDRRYQVVRFSYRAMTLPHLLYTVDGVHTRRCAKALRKTGAEKDLNDTASQNGPLQRAMRNEKRETGPLLNSLIK